ncbi:MAG: EAL domain-containing protein [Rhodocyclaceae bacterium]|nr:EAL domain-containing protein [Rhodocyclaceae bacterium]
MSRPRILSSLKSRIALFATALFIAAIWGLAFRSANRLREDEQQFLSAQQFAAAGFVADSIAAALRMRIDTLTSVAAAIDPAWLDDPRQLRRYLADRQTIYRLFAKGLCVIGKDGHCRADYPAVPGRAGADRGGEEFFRAVMASGRPAIGRPVRDMTWQQAAIVVAVPIGNERSGTVGVLAGTLLIAGSDVFHVVTHPRTAAAGNMLVVSPQDDVVIVDTDSTHILQPLPGHGGNGLYDRIRAEGFEGSAIAADAGGAEELAAVKSIPGTRWCVVNSMPTAQAFAPIRAMVAGIYRDAALLSLLVAALIWLFVRRELTALGRSARALNDMTSGAAPFHPLPVEGSDEIAQLAESFNDLQEQVVRQQAALRANEARFRQMFEGSSWITYLVDPATRQIVDANRAAAEFWGYAPAELQGMDICNINMAPPAEVGAGHRQALVSESLQREWHHRLKSGDIRDVETFVCPLPYGNRTLLYIIAFDITDRKQREEQEAVRNRIFELLARGGDLHEILDLVVRYVEGTHQGPLCAILLVDDSGKQLRLGAAGSLPDEFTAACDGLAIGEGNGSCGTAAFRNERVCVEDIQSHPFWSQAREQAARAGVAACWSEPLRDSAGKLVGTLAMFSRHAGAPSPADSVLIQQAANLAAIAIEKKRSDAELQLASSVYQASDEAIIVADADNRIVAVNPAFTRVTGYTLDEVRGRDPKLLTAGRTPRAEYDAMWQALKASGQWQGEIWNRRKSGEDYAEWLTINTLRDGDGELYRYIAMFSDITEKKRTAELVWRQANYDSLTGLPNRNLFYDRLHQEIRKVQRSSQLLALLYIDLDRFKEVNDAYGHDAGDQLLKQGAARIAACVRDADTVARLSGDEFAVVLPGVVDIGRVEQVAKDIVARLAQPFAVGAHTAYVSASVGIALHPNDAGGADALLKAADQAMYAAKQSGRNGFSYFTDSMQSAAQVRMELANSLRDALAKGQFEIFYQPIIDMQTGRIAKAEALLRWRHPEQGLILPAAFIPLAEELGLIGEIGDWVFRQSALVAKRWYNENQLATAVCRPLQVSVNKSPRQFVGGGKQEGWLGYLQRIGLPTRFMAIEITESLLLDDSPEVAAQLAELRASGVQVALDDFGTGYSAMSYLNKFRVDYVKIDQTFVQGISDDINDRAIVEAIVAMAHKLRLKVIAEGVETERQRDFLATVGCDFAQGYFFARPMPQAEFEALLDAAAPLPLARARDA